MGGMFATSFSFNQDLNNWDVSNVTNMRSMFAGSVFNQPLNAWNASSVTDMSQMFFQASSFNQALILGMLVTLLIYSNVLECTTFNQDISSWDVSNVTDMIDMFSGASSFQSRYWQLGCD